MEGKVKVIERLGLEALILQQQAMRSLKSLDPTKHKNMIADLKNDALRNQDTTYPVGLASMCDLATN